MQRLYDSRFGDGDVRDIRHYIRLGALGQAFAPTDRVVLLVDEIDKAEALRDSVRIDDLLADCGKHYKLILVGDALRAPYELLHVGGMLDLAESNRVEGFMWLMMLADHFDKCAWLNPEPARYWSGTTVEYIHQVFPMFELTLDGLGDAVAHLRRR